MKQVQLVKHPLVYDKISKLRDQRTGTQDFRRLLHELSIIIAVEATVHYPLKEITVETPMEKTTGKVLSKGVILIPILRAGLGMLNGFLEIIENAKIGYLGVHRNETTLTPVAYYENLPPHLDSSEIFVLDPMLATGGSAAYCLSIIKRNGGNHITLVTLFSAPEGVKFVNSQHPDVRIIAASLDRGLNGHGYILPGLGDAGDRINGTK